MKELSKKPIFWIVVILLIVLIFRWLRLKQMEERYVDPATLEDVPSWARWGQW